MNDGTTVPFEKKTLFLKQVRVSDLEEVEKLALYFFFPGYHEGAGFERADKLSEKSLLSTFHRSGFTVVRDNNATRRYAGDFSLPRSSYFTVCRNAEGDDGGLLMRELMTYSKPHMSGPVNLFDSTDPNNIIDKFRSMLRPGKSALFCIPNELRNFPSPFRKITGIENSDVTIAAIIPTQLVQITFERLIDVRMPNTRQWFVQEFTRLTTTIPKEATRLKESDESIPVFPIAGPLDDFKDLLPTLLDQGLGGGTGPTQAAGGWLRRLGAEALIFPSARADMSVSISHGELQDWYGWNLVDYRGAPPLTVGGFVLVFPEWDRYPTTQKHDLVSGESDDNLTPMEFSHVKVLANESGPDAGSLNVTGIELARDMYRDIALLTFYTNKMDKKLGDAVIELTFLAASDGQRRVYVQHVAGVSRMFLAALHGVIDAKNEVSKLPAIPHVASEGDYRPVVESFLSLCD
jgi:hypothetical protein